jgi:hypothetical protein
MTGGNLGNRGYDDSPKITETTTSGRRCGCFHASRALADDTRYGMYLESPLIDKERRVPRLSIIIPCLGGAAEFDGTLVSVLQNRPPDCEVLVVHTDSYDDPYQLGGEVEFMEAKASSIVDLLNVAIVHSTSELLHIVGCGLEATEHWTAQATAHFSDPEIAAVSPVVLGFNRQTVLAAGVSWSRGGARSVIKDQRIISPGSGRIRAKVLGPTLTAAYYRRDVLLALGGFDATVGDELADVDLALAIESLGRLQICEPSSRLVRVNDPKTAPASSLASGRAAERVFWRYAARRGPISSLGLHPCAVAADAIRRPALSMFASLAGRAAACAEMGAANRNAEKLSAAIEKLSVSPYPRNSGRKAAMHPADTGVNAAFQHRRAA